MYIRATGKTTSLAIIAGAMLALCGCGGSGDNGLNWVVSVSVIPTNPSIAKGLTQSFVARTIWQDGSSLDFSDYALNLTWTSSNTAVATVSASGVATSVGIGTTTITATLQRITVNGSPISASTTLTVTAPVPVSIAVTPANPALELGANQSFTATATMTDGSKQDLTQSATWSSSDPAVVRVNASAGRIGVANTRGPGSALIKAAAGSVSGQTNATVTRRTPKFLYSANLGDGTVSAFSVNPTSGALSPIGAPFATSGGSTSIAVTRDFKFLYSADFGMGNVSGFVIQPDGSLIPAAGTPIAAGNGPLSLVTHPTANFLYVAIQGSSADVVTYSIDPVSGALTLAGPTINFAPDVPEFAAASPDGKFYYQTLPAADQVVPYSINDTTGALTPVAQGAGATESFPRAIAIDPAGRFLYTAISDYGSGTSTTVDGFLIDPTTGALTKIPGSPFQAALVPTSIAIDPSGRFLYVACFNSSQITAFTIDPDTGALSPIQGSPFAAPGQPLFTMVDPSGLFLYVGTDSSTAGVLGYTIDQATGALTPNAAGSAPGNLVWSLAATR